MCKGSYYDHDVAVPMIITPPGYDGEVQHWVPPGDRLDVDPAGDPAHYGSAGDPEIAAQVRDVRDRMLEDPGEVRLPPRAVTDPALALPPPPGSGLQDTL